jgi:hypothetical protein
MQTLNEETPQAEEGFALHLRPRSSAALTIEVPADVLASVEKVAASRDMTVTALLKLYIGQELRQDLTKLFADQVLEKTAQVLTRHIQSEEEVSVILKEIRVESVA